MSIRLAFWQNVIRKLKVLGLTLFPLGRDTFYYHKSISHDIAKREQGYDLETWKELDSKFPVCTVVRRNEVKKATINYRALSFDYSSQSPLNKVLWWALFWKQNMKSGLVWAGWAVDFLYFLKLFWVAFTPSPCITLFPLPRFPLTQIFAYVCISGGIPC